MKLFNLRVGVLLIVIVYNGAINAAFIDNNTYTTDTVSGLDWLDITATINRSYDDINSQLSSEFFGWRYATTPEVYTLWNNFGVNLNVCGNCSLLVHGVHPVTAYASGLLGNADSISYQYLTIGLTSTVNEYWESGLYNDLIGLSDANGGTDTIIHDGYHKRSSAWWSIGSYLVRKNEVPAPNAATSEASNI